MEEENGTLDDIYGDAAPEDSSPETTEEVSEETPEETTELSNDTVPYDRFSEVNNKFREAESRAEQLERELQEMKAQQAPEETPEFDSAEDLIKYQDQKTDEKLNSSLSSRDAMWEAKLEAQNKMHQLEQEFPEIKEDPMFTEMITAKLQNDPNSDIIETANEIKQYFKTYEKRGRQAAEQELAQRGSFQGGVSGNQPLQQTDEDKAYAQRIVNASGGANSVF